MIFGRAWISAGSVIGVRASPQALPLRGVVAAQHCCALLLYALDLGKRFYQRVDIPGIARDDITIERFTHADSVGGEQKIGRASCRERGEVAGGGGCVEKRA